MEGDESKRLDGGWLNGGASTAEPPKGQTTESSLGGPRRNLCPESETRGIHLIPPAWKVGAFFAVHFEDVNLNV